MNFNKTLADAIAKGAARATRKSLTTLRRDVTELKRQVGEMKRMMQKCKKAKSVASSDSADAGEQAAEAPSAVRGIRPRGDAVRKLRTKLELTQAEFAKLAGVSILTVSKWERKEGRIAFHKRTQEALIRLRALGKKGVKAALGK